MNDPTTQLPEVDHEGIPSIDLSDEDILDAMRHIPGYLDITTGDFREVYDFAHRHAADRLLGGLRGDRLMRTGVEPLPPGMMLDAAARRIVESGGKSLPVVDEDGRVIGVLTETNFLPRLNAGTFLELLLRMVADSCEVSHRCHETPVREAMTAPAVTVRPQAGFVYNHYVNFGAEYVYHCHILSHEEMDMMRPVTLAFPPVAPSGLAFDTITGTLSWINNSRSETAFVVEKSTDGISWTEVGRIDRPLPPGAGSTIGDMETFNDHTWVMGDRYRVVAQNTVGDTWDYADPNLNEILVGGFPTITTTAISEVLVVTPQATPADPTNLTATLEAGPQINLAWTDNADNETGFIVERSDNGGAFVQIGTAIPGCIPQSTS